MTLKEAKKIVRELGLKLVKNDYDEFVVSGKVRGQRMEYFASDVEDAVGTAKAEVARAFFGTRVASIVADRRAV